MLLRTTAYLPLRLQGAMEEPRGDPEDSLLLLSPTVQLDQCCQDEGRGAALCMPWDAPWSTGSYRADNWRLITEGSAYAGRSTWCQAPLFAVRQAMGEMADMAGPPLP